MKEKTILFIIGLLVGALVTTGICYIYTKNNCNCTNNQSERGGMQKPPEMNGEEQPEKPEGEQGEPPEKPSNDSNNNKKSNS